MPRLTLDEPRVGLVGLGRWGANYVGAFRRAGVEVSAVCDVDGDRLRAAAEQAPDAVAVDGFCKLIESEIDAVILATPAATHAELAIAALDAGKHVLVEKPIALSVASARAVLAAAERARSVVAVGHLSLVSPVWRAALDRVGELRSFEAHRVSLGATHSDESALFGLASHDVASLVGPLGQTLTRVRARSLDSAHPDQHVALDAESMTGVAVHIRASRLGPAKQRRVSVAGTRGAETIDELAWNGVANGEDVLTLQCRRFLDRIRRGDVSTEDARRAVEVVRVVSAAAESLVAGGEWMRPVA